MRFLARFLFIFFLLTTSYLLLTTGVAHAQYSNPYITPNTDANVPANLHTYTQSIILEVLDGFTCQIIGFDPATASHQCLGFDTSTGKIGYVPSNGGAVGFATNMIASLYTPPIHTSDYVNYVASNFGFVKHTYAQTTDGSGSGTNGSKSSTSTNGIGFDKLTPLLSLWTTFRNISYLAFVIIFVAIGFAIMLRVKIDPRTVMTIENQIPKIIIALLLVTFSYAIAGFLIDMMYVTTYLTVNVITSSQEQAGNADTVKRIKDAETKDLAGGNPFGFANDVINGGLLGITAGTSGNVHVLIQNLLTGNNNPTDTSGNDPNRGLKNVLTVVGTGACVTVAAVASFGLGIPLCVAGGIATGILINGQDLGKVVANAVGVTVSWIAAGLAFFVIAIALLVALFRVWFTLLLTYVNILLEIVLAPFIIIAGVFPGSKVGFGSWFKSMVGNLLAFPVTVALFVLANVFMDNFAKDGTNLFVPPLIGNPQPSGGQSPVGFLIALGMVLLTPSVVGLTRGLVGAGDNKALGGIFANIGVGGKATGGIAKSTFGALFGQEIEYKNGQMQEIPNVIGRFWKGAVRKVSS